MARTEPPDLHDRLQFALALAQAAADVTMRYYRSKTLGVEIKSDRSPVTIADREAEAVMTTQISRHWPNDGILGEEQGEHKPQSPGRWILDPIDGTVSFARAVPLFGTLIAYEHLGKCVLGVISMPALSECVYAATGLGAWHTVANSKPVPARVSNTDSLDRAIVCTTALELFHAPNSPRLFDHLLTGGCRLRGWSDCYAHLLVATGRADAVIEPKIAPWDVAPMIPIMAEAGGKYTDWQGEATHLTPTGLSSNGTMHQTLINSLVPRA